ncbi:small ribosomal subunit Rsm22 family protein [Aureimonas populi]|uniref:Small ribosomal subunit Rsm22 family protein n=1 Tax=Aureimonas populi TaxID=1701758 RepID=A0ABW5CJ16_9HYPH|nr:small ribosomal subunit Rsm22 family protein [Aureimonas populi]
MELPAPLRRAIEDALAETPLDALRRAGETLSQRYRAETRDGRLHIGDDLRARAYVAARMPATYAAIREAMAQTAGARPDLAPRSLLDVGAGPGTVLWAAADAFDGLCAATLLEASDPIRRMAERLAGGAFAFAPAFVAGDARKALAAAAPADLVTLSYVLDEVSPEEGRRLVAELWGRTQGVLIIVEPGTPAGWRRILAARAQLLAGGAHLVAPCPHHEACPVAAPDWCHFARRLPRSRLHRLVKGGEAPFEDEKFAYLAVARTPAPGPRARILSMPRGGGGRISLKLCRDDGALEERVVSRRDGEAFKAARRAMWGGAF